MLRHVDVCGLCCAVCGHGVHVGVCGQQALFGPSEPCDCAHSLPRPALQDA